jgi:SAM-dependent methyltransferase
MPEDTLDRPSLESLLRCPSCGSALRLRDESASCGPHVFPVTEGIPRLLPPDLRRVSEGHREETVRARTYESFGFEWRRFADQLAAYSVSFRWYLAPLGDSPLSGRTVLDAGCGMGRFSHHFLKQGARVVALDASAAIEVAAQNNRGGDALFVQADLLHPPVVEGGFDLVCCLGVLHHLEDTQEALRGLARTARPGGWVLVYLYHDPGETAPWQGRLLSLVTAARRVTTRMPFAVLRPLTWLLAVALWLTYVLPLRFVVRVAGRDRAVGRLPLAWYVDYPFRILWNDQFDRFSAPLEKRYRRAEVEALMRSAGLEDVRILGEHGWRVAGRRPTGEGA